MNDLEKKLAVLKRMAAKDSKYNVRVIVVERMIKKAKENISTVSEIEYAIEPAYLMTKEEYIEKVSPILQSYNKFVKKNNNYLMPANYSGVFQYTFEEALSEVESGEVNSFFLRRGQYDKGETNFEFVVSKWNYRKYGDFGIKTKPEATPKGVTEEKNDTSGSQLDSLLKMRFTKKLIGMN